MFLFPNLNSTSYVPLVPLNASHAFSINFLEIGYFLRMNVRRTGWISREC